MNKCNFSFCHKKKIKFLNRCIITALAVAGATLVILDLFVTR